MGSGEVKFSIKELNTDKCVFTLAPHYFPYTCVCKTKWHEIGLGLHFIIFRRFSSMDDLSRNNKPCLYGMNKPKCDGLPAAFGSWNKTVCSLAAPLGCYRVGTIHCCPGALGCELQEQLICHWVPVWNLVAGTILNYYNFS